MELLDRCRLWLGLISGGMTLGVPEGGGGDAVNFSFMTEEKRWRQVSGTCSIPT